MKRFKIFIKEAFQAISLKPRSSLLREVLEPLSLGTTKKIRLLWFEMLHSPLLRIAKEKRLLSREL